MSEIQHFPFSAIVGHDEVKRALLLNAIDPHIGGVVIEGSRGMAKSTLARALADILPRGRFITLPLGATEERVVGSLNIDAVLNAQNVEFAPGLLHDAHGGVLYVDEVNLLADHLVDIILDAAASAINVVERDGVSHQHEARFVLVGTMNPDEGELRPQLLDRFGFSVAISQSPDADTRMAIVERRLAFDADAELFMDYVADQQTQLKQGIAKAQQRLSSVQINETLRRAIAERCLAANVEGVRADLVMLRAAKAYAAWQGRRQVEDSDVDAVAELALHHRRRQQETTQPTGQQPQHEGQRRDQTMTSGTWGELPPIEQPRGVLRDIEPLVKKKR